MRSSLTILLAGVPLAALLTGCAMSPMGGGTSSATDTPQSVTATVRGKSFGGQQPVAGATIAVYTYGTTGYGSTGTLLGTTTTASDGTFSLTFSCSGTGVTPTTPVYALSIGGTNGYSSTPNTAIVEAAGLGTCSAADADQFVIINEITTTVLATSLSHFFSSTSNDGTTTDHFGSPADLNAAIARVNDVLIPTVVNISTGYPNNSTATFTNESAKIITLGNILASCVNSSGPGSEYCYNLFGYTTPASDIPPTDVLEAAVNIALSPQYNVDQLYGLSASNAFSGGLTAYPTDWTIAVSYTDPSLGLGLNTRTVSTLDIDTSGRVWFPSNSAGAVGVAYFDPNSSNFSSVYTAAGEVHPQQVAIDINGTAWVTDTGSDVLAGFPTTNPSSPFVETLPGYTTTAVTVLDNDNLRVGLVSNSTTYPSLGQVIDTNGTSYAYTQISGTTVPSSGFIVSSLAGDTVGGSALSTTQTTGSYAYGYGFYFSSGNSLELAAAADGEDLGQVVFTSDDFVSARGGYSAAADGLCIYSKQNCYSMQFETAIRHPSGMIIDGGAGLWLADNDTPDVEFIPPNGTSYLDSGNVPYNEIYVHGTNNGGTMTNPAGIGVDNTGNVWVSNYGCYGNSCTPTAFVLTEVLGAGTPTINPVSAQVVLGTRGGAGKEPQ